MAPFGRHRRRLRYTATVSRRRLVESSSREPDWLQSLCHGVGALSEQCMGNRRHEVIHPCKPLKLERDASWTTDPSSSRSPAFSLEAGDGECVEEAGRRHWNLQPDTPPELPHDGRGQLARRLKGSPPRIIDATSRTLRDIHNHPASPNIYRCVSPGAFSSPSPPPLARTRSPSTVCSPRSSVCSPRLSPRALTVAGRDDSTADQSDRQNNTTTIAAAAARDAVMWGASGSQCSLCWLPLENGQQVVMAPSCADGMKV